jgi:glycosyltransferase involved in cell wall biosynthesis
VRLTVIQRMVPHYRAPLFARMYREFSWNVATAAAGPSHGLRRAVRDNDHEWLHEFDFSLNPLRQYSAKVPLDDIRRTLNPDCILAEFSLQMSSSWRLALARKSKRPLLVYWSQGSNVERGFKRPRDLISQILRLLLLSRADAHICYSAEGAQYLRRWVPSRAPVFVANNTLAVEDLIDRELDTSPEEASHARLICVGRLTPEKRVPLLVDAFALLLESMPNLHLTIVGDGADMQKVRTSAAALPPGSIDIAGEVYDDAVLSEHFRQSSMFVSVGSAGLGVIHALAFGLPVVLCEGAGIHHHPEHCHVVHGVTGFRLNVRDPEALSAELKEILAQKASPKAAMREAIYGYVKSNLMMDRMMDGFRNLNAFLQDRLRERQSKGRVHN